MDNGYASYVRFTPQPGQADALVAILLEGTAALAEVEACRLCLISRAAEGQDTVWMTEAWTSREAREAWAQDPRAQGAVQRALPLLAGSPQVTELRPAGGKGL